MREDRAALLRSYFNIEQPLWRTWIDYDRYYEADIVLGALRELGEDIASLSVVDYGCAIGDYGMEFLRNGANVRFVDFKYMVDFVSYRVLNDDSIELHRFQTTDVDENMDPKNIISQFTDVDIIIFGEILEHLHNPLAVVEACYAQNVNYLWTTAFPYVSDPAYFEKHDHHVDMNDQTDCARFLEEHYESLQFTGQLRLWKRK